MTERLEARAQAYSGPAPKNLCLLVWTEERPKAVQACIPFWLLKIKSGRGLKLDVPNGEARKLELSARDLERAGPALLLDEEHDRAAFAGVDGIEAGLVLASGHLLFRRAIPRRFTGKRPERAWHVS